MITIDEIREMMIKEYGIKTDKELDNALKRIGGIRIAVFTDIEKEGKTKEKAPVMV